MFTIIISLRNPFISNNWDRNPIIKEINGHSSNNGALLRQK